METISFANAGYYAIQKVAEKLAKLEPFNFSNGRAINFNSGITGKLNNNERDLYERHSNEIDYVIIHYSTPLAWHTNDGRWHLVGQKFSVSTSKLQGRIRTAVRLSYDINRSANDVMTCGTCGFHYPDNTPAGRCPNEYEHGNN